MTDRGTTAPRGTNGNRPPPQAPHKRLDATAQDGTMVSEVMDITPAQAAEFLRMNITNRPLRPSWVRTLMGKIERGEWKVTHQGIAITADNRLLDGQHRLQAVVNTGITVRMQVSFDCDPDSFRVLDSGVHRTTSDHLGIPQAVATLAKALWRVSRPHDKGIPSSDQVAATLEWARGPIDEVLERCGGTRKQNNSAVQLALVVHVMGGRPEVLDKIKAFQSGDLDAMPSSLRGLYKQILEGKASARTNHWDLCVRSMRAFEPRNWPIQKIQVKDVDNCIAEMARITEAYRKVATKATR